MAKTIRVVLVIVVVLVVGLIVRRATREHQRSTVDRKALCASYWADRPADDVAAIGPHFCQWPDGEIGNSATACGCPSGGGR